GSLLLRQGKQAVERLALGEPGYRTGLDECFPGDVVVAAGDLQQLDLDRVLRHPERAHQRTGLDPRSGADCILQSNQEGTVEVIANRDATGLTGDDAGDLRDR